MRTCTVCCTVRVTIRTDPCAHLKHGTTAGLGRHKPQTPAMVHRASIPGGSRGQTVDGICPPHRLLHCYIFSIEDRFKNGRGTRSPAIKVYTGALSARDGSGSITIDQQLGLRMSIGEGVRLTPADCITLFRKSGSVRAKRHRAAPPAGAFGG